MPMSMSSHTVFREPSNVRSSGIGQSWSSKFECVARCANVDRLDYDKLVCYITFE